MKPSVLTKASGVRSGNSLSSVFRNERGVFDMPSIIIGAIVVGVLTAGILAGIFGVVPFTQDKAAQQDLGAVVTAQGAYYAQSVETEFTTNASGTNSYAGLADLQTQKLMPELSAKAAAKIAVEGGTGGWVAVTRSDSGMFYMVSNNHTTPVELGKLVDRAAAMTAAKAKTPVVDLGTVNAAG